MQDQRQLPDVPQGITSIGWRTECTSRDSDIDEFGCPDPNCPHWIGRQDEFQALNEERIEFYS